METWRSVWRNGFVPVLSRNHLEKLRDALLTDDPRLTQGSTSIPPPLMCVQKWDVEAACAIGFCGWQGGGYEGERLVSVEDVEMFFTRACYKADLHLGEPAACREWLNWYDDTQRDEMRAELLSEVELALGNLIDPQSLPTAPVAVPADTPAAA